MKSLRTTDQYNKDQSQHSELVHFDIFLYSYVCVSTYVYVFLTKTKIVNIL